MRLQSIETGHRWREKLLLHIIPLVTADRSQPHDVIKTMMYRPEFFGKHFTTLQHAVMRGPSAWTVGERELFASFTSHLNACRY